MHIAFCLFGIGSGYGFITFYLFCIVLCFTKNILTYKFTENKFNFKFDYKVRQTLKQSGEAYILKCRANVITKFGSFLY